MTIRRDFSELESRRVAVAVGQLHAQETVFLDGSALALAAAGLIVARGLHVNVVTTSLAVASALDRHELPAVEITLAGGRFDPASRSFAGACAAATIASRYSDRALIGCDAVDALGRLAEPDPRLAAIKSAMLEQAHVAVLMLAPDTAVVPRALPLRAVRAPAVAVVAAPPAHACRAQLEAAGVVVLPA